MPLERPRGYRQFAVDPVGKRLAKIEVALGTGLLLAGICIAVKTWKKTDKWTSRLNFIAGASLIIAGIAAYYMFDPLRVQDMPGGFVNTPPYP